MWTNFITYIPTELVAIWTRCIYVKSLNNNNNVKSLKQPRFNTVTYGRDSFSYQGAQEWNILYNFIKDAASLNGFKMLIKTWNGEQYNCNYCHVFILERI